MNPLGDPPQVEHKFYARDVGPVLVIGISGGSEREELLSYTPVGPAHRFGSEDPAKKKNQISKARTPATTLATTTRSIGLIPNFDGYPPRARRACCAATARCGARPAGGR